jgi:ankyrin repeat protein
VVRVLIKGKANVNFRTASGDTAIGGAVNAGNVTMVRDLIAAGAKVNVTDSIGRPLLKVAQMIRNNDIVAMLKKAGAKE